jgi:outer membrane lipase/esterase
VLTPYKLRGLCLNIAFHKKERSFYLLMHLPKLGANTMVFWKHALGALGVALALVGCGGGSDAPVIPVSSAPPAATPTVAVTPVNTVKVVGDSLSDSGVFGFKWAMQGNAANQMKVWPEIIADSYSAPALCPYYSGNPLTGVVTVSSTGSACNSYAVGGAKINIGTTTLSAYSIPKQLADLAANKSYTASDLLLVDGGGNDVAALTGAYLAASTDMAASFITLTGSVLGTSTVTPIVFGNPSTGTAVVGTLYMQALADKLYDAVKAEALDKGAPRVLVLNVPNITLTPRFTALLAGVEAQVAAGPGGASAGAQARLQVQGLINSWIVAFNSRLTNKFAGNSKVAISDFYTEIQAKITTPSNFGLTNITDTACQTIGSGSDGLPAYNPVTCTADSLTALSPAPTTVGGANWWKTYYFSDGFHPSIKGYQLLAADVLSRITTAGWK